MSYLTQRRGTVGKCQPAPAGSTAALPSGNHAAEFVPVPVGKDDQLVCRRHGSGHPVLVAQNPRNVWARLDGDEKYAVQIMDAIGRAQLTTIVTRPGLTKVLRESRKPEAKAAADRFDRWVRHEVLEQVTFSTKTWWPSPQMRLSQSELAQDFEVTDQTIANYEKGKTKLGHADPLMRMHYLLSVLPAETRVETIKLILQHAPEKRRKLPDVPRRKLVEHWVENERQAA